MKRQMTALCIAAAVMGFTGCLEAKDAAPNEAKKAPDAVKKAIGKKAEQSDETVILRCGTNDFTMGEARRLAELRARLSELSMAQSPSLENLMEAFLPRIIASTPNGFARDCAIAAFAAENGISASAEDVELMRKRAMQGAKQDFISWGSFMGKLSAEQRATLDGRIKIEALTEAVRKWHETNRPAPVTDEEIAEYRRRQREYNAMAAATNDLTYATATNVWKELQGGLDFGDAVDMYSTDENDTDGGEWGDFMLDYFSDSPAIQTMLPTMTPGQISPPVEGDNGLMIIRLDDLREEGDGRPIYTISRIFFHLPEFYPELDDEAFKREICTARQQRTFNEFVEELAKKLTVTYPAGEFIFENARRTAAQPVMM